MSESELPNLFLIGTHKGGTTSFYEMLATHPAIHAPEPKEPGYFSLTPTITPSNLDQYASIYRSATAENRFRLDGSTSYAQTVRYPDTVSRIREHCGTDLKFIYLLRDPIERMRAAYVQLRSEGNNDLPRDLEQALPRLIEPTMYLHHYEAYAAVWVPESIFVATFEELISEPETLTTRCLDFLGIEVEVHFSDLPRVTQAQRPVEKLALGHPTAANTPGEPTRKTTLNIYSASSKIACPNHSG